MDLFSKSVILLFLVSISARCHQCKQSCVDIKVLHGSTTKDSTVNLTFTATSTRDCFSKLWSVQSVVIERVTMKPTYPNLCQVVVYTNGTCMPTKGCGCMPDKTHPQLNIYSISHRAQNPTNETWRITVNLQNSEKIYKSFRIQDVISVVEENSAPTQEYAMTTGDNKNDEVDEIGRGGNIAVGLGVPTFLVIIIAAVVYCYRKGIITVECGKEATFGVRTKSIQDRELPCLPDVVVYKPGEEPHLQGEPCFHTYTRNTTDHVVSGSVNHGKNAQSPELDVHRDSLSLTTEDPYYTEIQLRRETLRRQQIQLGAVSPLAMSDGPASSRGSVDCVWNGLEEPSEARQSVVTSGIYVDLYDRLNAVNN